MITLGAAGPRVAAVRDYLSSILPGLANFPINRIGELTPASWAAAN